MADKERNRLHIAIPTAPAEKIVEGVYGSIFAPDRQDFGQTIQISGKMGDAIPKPLVRISPTEVVTTWTGILSELEEDGLVTNALGKWVNKTPDALGRMLRKRPMDAMHFSGMVVRDRSGSDFFAFEVRDETVRRYALNVGIDMLKRFNFAPLSLFFGSEDTRVCFDWNGNVGFESERPIGGVEAMNRYAAIKDRYSLRFSPIKSPDDVAKAGFRQELVDLYTAMSWGEMHIQDILTRGMHAA